MSENADDMSMVALVAEAWVVIVVSAGVTRGVVSVDEVESDPKMFVVPKVLANSSNAAVIAVSY